MCLSSAVGGRVGAGAGRGGPINPLDHEAYFADKMCVAQGVPFACNGHVRSGHSNRGEPHLPSLLRYWQYSRSLFSQ